MIVCSYPRPAGGNCTRYCCQPPSGLERAVVVERADDGQGLGTGEDIGGDRADVLVADGVDRAEHLLDRLQPRVDQPGLAEAAPPRGRLLQAEPDRAAPLAR